MSPVDREEKERTAFSINTLIGLKVERMVAEIGHHEGVAASTFLCQQRDTQLVGLRSRNVAASVSWPLQESSCDVSSAAVTRWGCDLSSGF